MTIFRLTLVVLPLVGIAILTWRRWHHNHATGDRSVLLFIGVVAGASIAVSMLGAGVGMELYCKFSDGNLCGLGGLLLGGFGGACLGGIGACWTWYRSGRSASGS